MRGLGRDVTGGRWRRRAPWIVAAAFSVSGVVHLAHPATFTRIVPAFLPGRTWLVYLSGVAELVCAAGLWRRARWAGLASAVLLIAIWPANLQMAVSAQEGRDLTTQIEDWVRLPLQIPLVWCALQGRRRSARRCSSGSRAGTITGPVRRPGRHGAGTEGDGHAQER